MRTLVPAETLVYLETNDLAAALQPIVDAKPFKDVAKTKPDFSALKGVQLAVAVTGFETSEEKLTDEHSVGRVQPRFVAVADTHAWNYQAVAFAEQKLGGFVADIYDSEATVDRSDKHGGKYFIWTAVDGRKAYALVVDSIIYFGNDESAIDKCLAVKRGESDSVAKAGKVKVASHETLASGYVSTDGVAQIANIVGLQFASQASEESEVQSAIAGILPQLIRNSVTDINWIAAKTERGFEDKYQITMPSEVANVFSETLVSNAASDRQMDAIDGIISRIPADMVSSTRYNLKAPQLAWRSVLLVAKDRTDAISGNLIAAFGQLLFVPYGIRDPEMFLSSLGNKDGRSPNIVTAKLDLDSEDPIVLSMSGDQMLMRKSFVSDLKLTSSGEDGWSSWSTTDDEIQVLFEGDPIAIGSGEEIEKFNKRRSNANKEWISRLATSDAPVVTLGKDSTTTLSLIAMLAREGHGDTQAVSTYLTETRFTKTGMERKTTSDFGLIGSIIAQLAQD